MDKTKVKEVQHQIELDEKTAMVATNKYKERWYLMFRFMYEDSDGQLKFGKNGVNIAIEEAEEAIVEMIAVLNEATGSVFELTSKGAPDADA